MFCNSFVTHSPFLSHDNSFTEHSYKEDGSHMVWWEKYDLWLNEIEPQKPACAVATIDDGHGLINLHVQ